MSLPLHFGGMSVFSFSDVHCLFLHLTEVFKSSSDFIDIYMSCVSRILYQLCLNISLCYFYFDPFCKINILKLSNTAFFDNQQSTNIISFI